MAARELRVTMHWRFLTAPSGQRRRVEVLETARHAAHGSLQHAGQPSNVDPGHGTDDAELQPVRLLQNLEPGAGAQPEPAPQGGGQDDLTCRGDEQCGHGPVSL